MQGGLFLSLPPQKYEVFILLLASSQILWNSVKKMKSQILLVAFLIAENGHFSQIRGGGLWFE